MKNQPKFEVEVVHSVEDFVQAAIANLPFPTLETAQDFADRFNIATDFEAEAYLVARVFRDGERVPV